MAEKFIKVAKVGGGVQEVCVLHDHTMKDVAKAAGISNPRKARATKSTNGSGLRDVSLDTKANGYKYVAISTKMNGGN